MFKYLKINNFIIWFFVELYLISITSFQLRYGIDRYFLIGSFSIMIFLIIIFKRNVSILSCFKWSIFFWGFYFLSLIWAKSSVNTMDYFFTCFQIICIFLFFPSLIKDYNDIDNFLNLIVLSLVFSSIILLLRTPFSILFTTRFGEPIGIGANMIGMRMAFAELICLYLFDKNHSKKYIFFIVLFILIALLTGSKKALIIIIFGTLLYKIFSSNKKTVIFSFFKYLFLGFLVIIMCFKIPFLYNTIGSRVEVLYYTVFSGDTVTDKIDYSYIERKFYINKAVELFLEHPIVGYGGNNFSYRMEEIKYWHVSYSHNNYTELLSTLGLIGFIIYYLYFIYILFTLFKCESSNLKRLFLIIVFLILFLDYSNVTYIQRFNMILISVICCFMEKICFNKKGVLVKW